ncbi:MAG: exodeoxyribonuclease VII large subunit [Bacteroidales bacterium]|nr:exodeoxyribonuclease VII large subunit [Bacteroidales bacterium]
MGTENSYVDLATLLAAVKDTVAEAFPVPVWVKAEISSWSPRANGHCYLELSQSRGGKLVAQTRAMIWSWKYLSLESFFEKETGQQLQAGLTVLVQVKVNYSELYGVSLYVENIDPAFTLGEKALERKRIIERLTAQGYMDMQKELALPDIPRHLAVITSKTAAGYQDFRNHLLNNEEGYAFVLQLFEASMQGADAPESIARALQEASEKNFDAILILRGGGSELDLACFDDEDLSIAIATCPVPVVTAIGHDKDVHIADMVAGQAVKTPTALADLFIDAFREQDEKAKDAGNRIESAIQKRVARAELELQGKDAAIHRTVQRRLSEAQQALEARFGRVRVALQRRVGAMESPLQRSVNRISKGLTRKVSDAARQMDGEAHRIKFAAGARLSTEVSKIALKEALIKASDPRNILQMGYVLVTGKDNKVLKTVDRVHSGDHIGVRFSDGSLTAKVENVYSETKDQNKTNIA